MISIEFKKYVGRPLSELKAMTSVEDSWNLWVLGENDVYTMDYNSNRLKVFVKDRSDPNSKIVKILVG